MQWTIKKTKLSELKEYHKNPRKLTKKQLVDLKKSIKTFGLCEPIVANLDDVIIGGHQRVKAMLDLGTSEADVYFPAELLTEKQVEELNVRLNRNSGEWDYDILANSFDLSELVSWGFEAAEFGIELEQEEKPKPIKLNITFSSDAHVDAVEAEVSKVIERFDGVSYKIKR